MTAWSGDFGTSPNQGRIGLDVNYSDTLTQRTVSVGIYYWTKSQVSDSSNTFRYDWGDGSGSQSLGSRNIQTGGTQWSSANVVHISTITKTFNKGTSAVTRSVGASFSTIEYGGGSGSLFVNYTIPALSSYTLTYDANGGTNAPAKQTWYYGKNIVISNTIPIRVGYTFVGWARNKDSETIDYSPGSTFSGTQTASVTLYAVWKINEYTITYNANGGSFLDESSEQIETRTYNEPLGTLRTDLEREGYDLLGWATSSGAKEPTVSEKTIVQEELVLYAVWRLKQLTVVFDAGEFGTFSSGSRTSTKIVSYGTQIGKMPEPTRKNYKFLGYSSEGDWAEPDIEESTVIAEDMHLYAVYTLQANCYVKQNGIYVPGMLYRKNNGMYQTGAVSVKDNGEYKEATL